jgi:superfamily II DNA/RNA helicase
MSKALKEAPEIVVATPGRFIEMVRTKAYVLMPDGLNFGAY